MTHCSVIHLNRLLAARYLSQCRQARKMAEKQACKMAEKPTFHIKDKNVLSVASVQAP